jgi:2-oxoglutarate ferredoxin oxidoreductase subunit delta
MLKNASVSVLAADVLLNLAVVCNQQRLRLNLGSRRIMKYWRQPLDRDRIQIPRGIVHIIEERCKGCGFCVEFCPRQVFVVSKRTNPKGYHPPEIADSSHCTDCGLCALLCPDFAIYIESSQIAAKDLDVIDK